MRTFARGRRTAAAVAGFTLAEAAVTIAIVAIVLLMVVQGLESAKSSAYYTKVHKTAYELGVTLLGEVRSGIYREELDSGLSGNFADRDEPAYTWEILLGEDVFEDVDDEERGFDNFAERRRRREEREESNSLAAENDEEVEEPFEKIKVRVVFPVLNDDRPNELILEAWVPWEEVYGPSEEEESQPAAGEAAAGAAGGAGGAAGAAGAGAGAGAAGRGDAK